MINIKLEIPSDLREKLSPATMGRILRQSSLAIAKEIEAEARPYPGPSHSPVIWKSAAQRRAYFASRAGLNPAYTRQSDPNSQRIMQSWAVTPYGDFGAKLDNSATYAPYVIGEQQQPQHEATGWKILYNIADEFVKDGKVQKIIRAIASKILG